MTEKKIETYMQEFSKEAMDKVQQGLTNYGGTNNAPHISTETQQILKNSTTSLLMKSEIGSSSKKVKTVKVRTRPSDGMGAAPLPEGYAASIAVTSNIKVPQSYHETMRIAQEQRPYVPKKEIKQNKKVTIRAAGGEVWEDPSLIYWDEDDYRLFVGDLGNEVTDDLLAKSFSRYPSLQRTHVVRDKRSAKSKGFGFISFSDPDDYVKAMREMNGKYVGNRPITLKRSNWKERGANPENMARQKELAAIAKLPPKKYTGKNKN